MKVANVLLRQIDDLVERMPAPLRFFGLPGVLRQLQTWVSDVERRLEILEGRAVKPVERAALGIVETARAEGQLHGSIKDETRPGGPRPGDVPL